MLRGVPVILVYECAMSALDLIFASWPERLVRTTRDSAVRSGQREP